MELTAAQLTKCYQNHTILRNVSFCLSEGFHCLIGKNGAGKTALIRLLCGIEMPDSGEILWNQKNILSLHNRYKAHIGYLPQHFGFYPNLTIKEYLLYISALKGLRPIVAKFQTEDLLKKYRLETIETEKMAALSGGQQALVGIIQALLGEPDILYLDEPFSALDPLHRTEVLNDLRAYSKTHIVLLSTHLIEEIANWADHLLILRGGQLQFNGNRGKILEADQSHQTTGAVLSLEDANSLLTDP